jgi:methylated-DNA-protein-cysteine methyltransferase-like protein
MLREKLRSNIHLPPAYVRIWNATVRVPRGRVSTYGAIAALAGLSGQPRLAGYALHNLPVGADIPWQRVINARGMISLEGKAGARQRLLLEEEGVVFRKKKVDLAAFGWPATLRNKQI